MVTASGSGLDSNISVQGAKIQVKRIAKIRNIGDYIIYQLIEKILKTITRIIWHRKNKCVETELSSL